MYTLGINAVFHDCAATLVHDGVVVAAAEEERFTHVKHGKRPLPFTTWQLPFHAIDYCLAEAGIALRDVDRFAYSFNPALLHDGGDHFTLPVEPSRHTSPDRTRSPWDPLFRAYVVNAPRQLADGAPHHLQARLRGLSTDDVATRWQFVDHHLAHEASAYLAAPFERCAVLTLDGRGERACTSYGVYDAGTYHRLKQVDLPNSLGLLYEDVTRHLGFLHSSDEYKVMALASYGEDRCRHEFERIVQVDDAGNYRIEPYDLTALFGPPRLRDAPLDPLHFEIAHSLQKVLERTVARMVAWLHRESGMTQLAMAGGVALNCVLNARLRDEGPFDDIWVQPAAGDAGTALGAALWVDAEHRKPAARTWKMDHAFYGPAYADAEIEAFLKRAKLPYRRLTNVAEDVADLLAANKVIGWFQGRMEFGPRALGARSILASPIDPGMQALLNEIKDREDFRPVAPAVMEEHASSWFVATRPGTYVAPFMLFVFDVLPDKAHLIPAVRHVDGTARVQTVRRDQHPLYYDLLAAFAQRTGVPVLVNTSFNTRGEPVVCTPRDAIESFWTSPLDALSIGSFLLEKQA